MLSYYGYVVKENQRFKTVKVPRTTDCFNFGIDYNVLINMY